MQNRRKTRHDIRLRTFKSARERSRQILRNPGIGSKRRKSARERRRKNPDVENRLVTFGKSAREFRNTKCKNGSGEIQNVCKTCRKAIVAQRRGVQNRHVTTTSKAGGCGRKRFSEIGFGIGSRDLRPKSDEKAKRLERPPSKK